MLSFTAQCEVSLETRARNIELCKDYPSPAGSGVLTVIGGGPSVLDHGDELRALTGDIWAINGAAQWCNRNGIKAALYSLDASEEMADVCEGIEVAILASHCDPKVFKALEGRQIYRVSPDVPGPTSAVGALVLAIEAGYTHVRYYGCESSYAITTHAYDCLHVVDLIRVNGFLSKPEFLMQAEQLAMAIRKFPDFYSERSGALLSSLIANPDYEISHISKQLHSTLVEVA